jgi:hypothetical protein
MASEICPVDSTLSRWIYLEPWSQRLITGIFLFDDAVSTEEVAREDDWPSLFEGMLISRQSLEQTEEEHEKPYVEQMVVDLRFHRSNYSMREVCEVV